MRLQIAYLTAMLVAAFPASLSAQDEIVTIDPVIEVDESVFEGDWFAVGFGVGVSGSYDGSDDYNVNPVPLVAGELLGIGISPRAGGLAFQWVDLDAGRVDVSFGTVARIRTNRASQIKDNVVQAAGELDQAFEVGPTFGIGMSGIFTKYDRLSFGLDLRWDVAGAHSGLVVDPGVSYRTPLSRGMVLGLSAGGQYVDGDYADYYYSVSPQQSLASGLTQFQADSGWHKAGVSAALGVDLDGNLENGGFIVGFAGGYTRMLGDAADTPFTSVRGDDDQFFGAAGVGFVF